MIAVGFANEHQAALKLVGLWKPQVLIVGSKLPGSDTGQFVRESKEACSTTRCLVIADSTDDVKANPLRDAGAFGLLPDTASKLEILTCIRAVANGRLVEFADQPATDSNTTDAAESTNSIPAEKPVHLDDLDRKILERIRSKMTVEEIGRTIGMEPEDVESHYWALLQRLDFPTYSELIELSKPAD